MPASARSCRIFRRGLYKAMIELNTPIIKQILDKFPDCLDPRAKQVIEMRYGINGGKSETLQKIADSLGVSRERVRQIEKRALRKLTHPSRLKKLSYIV